MMADSWFPYAPSGGRFVFSRGTVCGRPRNSIWKLPWAAEVAPTRPRPWLPQGCQACCAGREGPGYSTALVTRGGGVGGDSMKSEQCSNGKTEERVSAMGGRGMATRPWSQKSSGIGSGFSPGH